MPLHPSSYQAGLLFTLYHMEDIPHPYMANIANQFAKRIDAWYSAGHRYFMNPWVWFITRVPFFGFSAGEVLANPKKVTKHLYKLVNMGFVEYYTFTPEELRAPSYEVLLPEPYFQLSAKGIAYVEEHNLASHFGPPS